MRLRSLIILIANGFIMRCCFCQSVKEQEAGTEYKTIYITKYDSNPPPLNFRSFGVKDGLPRGVINDLVQTDDGFVWLAIFKVGLVRFDGYHFRIFKPVVGDTNNLPDDYIFQIVKSSRKGLWIGSHVGIIWFDLTTYKTNLIRLPSGFPPMYYHLFEDSHQRLWVYWAQQFYLYDPASGIFTEIKNRIAKSAIKGKKINIETASFYEMKESENGELFILGNLLLKYNPESSLFTTFNEVNNNRGDYTRLVLDEDKEHIWLSGWKGLRKFNYKSGSTVNYNFQRMGAQANIENHSFAAPKNNHQLWLPNEQQIRIFDKNTGKVALYRKKNNENLLNTEFSTKGINGIEWFWNSKGFVSLQPVMNRFIYNKLLPEEERVLCQWHDGKKNTIWFGSEDRKDRIHLYKYDAGKGKLTEIIIPVKARGSIRFIIPLFSNTCVLAIADIQSTSKLSEVYSKLFLLNTETNSLTYISKPVSNHTEITTDSLKYRNAYPDKAGNYWITTEGQGLVHYDTKTQQFFQYTSSTKDTSTLSSNYVYSAACGNDNTIWTGSDYEVDSVINKLNVVTGKVQRILLFSNNFRIQPLCEDKNGNVWISTNSGLATYNRYTGKKNLVPEIAQLITRAFVDLNGNIIAINGEGIWIYDPIKKIARRFDEQDGIRLEYFEDNYISKRICLFNDSIFISDSYCFPVSELYPKKEVPPLHFTHIKIFGKELTTIKNVDALHTLILPHGDNQISFEFAALSYLSPERNNYACMLQGADKGWQQLGAENSVTYANLDPGNYTFRVKTANPDGVWGSEKDLFIRLKPAFWQTIIFKALIIILVAGFFYWLYRNRLKQINLKNLLRQEHLEALQKDSEFKRRLSEIQLTALRSQMNPHFIFNCLNSIKLYTTQNNTVAAAEYLTKFSRLIRLVLENSRSEKITLAAELDALYLYMEMEAMRFKEKLKYNITVEKEVDMEYIEIPPLLLQPYVENAVWHGLMHKEEGGQVYINVSMQPHESVLIVNITDDGIGRIKSAALMSKTAIKHKSFGMKVTSERLSLINRVYRTGASVTIDDLTDHDGLASGTRVTIKIPLT